MVGRLVEQQNVRLRRHDTGKRSAARLATRKRTGAFVAGKPEAFDQIGGAIRIVCRSQAGLDIGEHTRVAVHVGLLRQVAHGRCRLPEYLAVLRLDHAGSDLEQRRFSRSVATHKRDLLARRCGERSAIKQRRAAEGQPDAVEGKKRWSHGHIRK